MDEKFNKRFVSFCNSLDALAEARKRDLSDSFVLSGTSAKFSSVANKYGCSYGQVYAWVRKYKDKGIEGLYDRRGKNKASSQLSDIEKLKAENRLLKAQTQQQQMEIDFLKNSTK